MPKDILQHMNEIEVSSSDEWDSPPSDIEYLRTDVGDVSMTDYWIGQKYFEFALGLQAIGEGGQDETWIKAESRLSAKLQNFPYRNVFPLLQGSIKDISRRGMGHSDGEDDRNNFLALVGAILTRGTTKDKKAMLEVLRMESRQRQDAASTFAHNPKVPQRPLLNQEQSKEVTAAFASTLKEYGDQIGEQAVCHTDIIRPYPPEFQATLVFRGDGYKGRGGSKKAAQHQAALLACQSLGLQPPTHVLSRV